jgi:hypothetical protein
MQKIGPKEWSNYPAKKDRSPIRHWQHGSIEQPDQCANIGMDDRCGNQSIPMKGRDVSSRCVGPVRNARASKEIHRIPDTVLGQIAVKKSWEIITMLIWICATRVLALDGVSCLAWPGIISWCSSGRHCFAHPATPQQYANATWVFL